VDRRVGGIDSVQLRDIVSGLGQHAGGMHGAAGGELVQVFDIGFQDADIAIGKAGRSPAPLLQLGLAGGGTRLDEKIANAQLLDEAQRFLLRAGPDGEHADHRADAEHDTERGQQRARLLRAQVVHGLPHVGEVA
jgi:hypothetical protein